MIVGLHHHSLIDGKQLIWQGFLSVVHNKFFSFFSVENNIIVLAADGEVVHQVSVCELVRSSDERRVVSSEYFMMMLLLSRETQS